MTQQEAYSKLQSMLEGILSSINEARQLAESYDLEFVVDLNYAMADPSEINDWNESWEESGY